MSTPYRSPKGIEPVVSLAGLLLLWIVAAHLTDDPSVLPGPLTVLTIAGQEFASGKLQYHVLATLGRVAVAFALAMGLGGALGLALGSWSALDRWISPWVTVFLNLPALVVIVLCYLWFGLNEPAAILAVAVNKTAMVAVTVREGVRSLDPQLSAMARLHRMSPLARFAHVIWPQLWPYVAASTRNGLAMIWKIVLVVEFLGRSNGVGFQIHLYFQLFETGHVLAYALSFVAVMLALEYGLLQPLDRRSRRWQATATAS
ncbi:MULTISPECIES: ABC transporter permease [unclassified Meridianimarinicoccus]|uniref:ABC transporter permease n=1 Tax=unclassified Meridianimarinicoccus TaxID=2923344 RepID=UPI001865F8DB|nr:ABC transporter permease [Fluviibacterium sp. MJW13]